MKIVWDDQDSSMKGMFGIHTSEFAYLNKKVIGYTVGYVRNDGQEYVANVIGGPIQRFKSIDQAKTWFEVCVLLNQ